MKNENPYLAIAETALENELIWLKENNEKIAETINANKDAIVRVICNEIQMNDRIEELIREDVLEAIREYWGTDYEIY